MISIPSVGLLSSLADSLCSAFFPDSCRVCDLPLEGWTRTPVCQDCWDRVAPANPAHACIRCGMEVANPHALDEAGHCAPCIAKPPAYDRFVSFNRHEGVLRKLIHLLKYDQLQPLARPLAAKLAELRPAILPTDLVLGIPLHWRRRRERGFNQSALIAAQAAAAWGLPFDNGILKRTKPTPPQAGLTRAERLVNVRGAFKVRRPQAVQGRRIVIIDDVMTTGATLDACARALKRAGAEAVIAVTLARAAPEGRVSG